MANKPYTSAKAKRRAPKKAPLSQDQAKAVVKLAQKATMKLAETKSGITSQTYTPIADTITVQNLNYFMNQGDQANQYNGEKVFLKNIRIKGLLQHNTNTLGGGASGAAMRLVVFKSKETITSTYANNVSYSKLFRGDGATDYLAFRAHVDLHHITLLHDQLYTFSSVDSEGLTNVKQVDINVPINKTEYYDAENSGVYKRGNYYMALVPYKSSVNSIPIAAVMTWAVNVKDI